MSRTTVLIYAANLFLSSLSIAEIAPANACAQVDALWKLVYIPIPTY